ncbi:MAG: dihydropteroate synthase [Lentisphaerae bacterium]|nr:dihydropteroate synthase [Lentisphaerota bacterium]MCP4101303.1 dihydropteroate synthase [Lentisphaerota bacterium]
MRFCFKNRSMDFQKGSKLMGVLNVTPDSFSDGGEFFDTDIAVKQALTMLEDGAAVIDIGGESTRPGSREIVTVEMEINRICPVISKLRQAAPDCVISADTRRAEVARVAVEAGADIINDVSGLQYSNDMAAVAAETGVGLILMHMRGAPDSMQKTENLKYGDIVEDICAFLTSAAAKALDYGVNRENIVLDPGIGFAKSVEQNLKLIGQIDRLRQCGYPVLVGHSRKSFIGKIFDREDPQERILATAGAAIFLAEQNVEFIRVHDVRAVNDALTMYRLCAAAQ